MINNSIFFQCQVLDNQDPLMLGRVRARLLVDNYNDIINAITDPVWNEEKDKWTARDPFIFNPLLPYFIYQVPKVDEMIQVIYVNKDFKYQNQYYVQNTFSSPTATGFEYYVGANKFTGTGTQLTNPKPLKNQDGTYTDQEIHKGVFPQPGDNAILGRGSADLIVKQDEILLRAGKYKGLSLLSNVVPVGNQWRGFLQLSRFPGSKIKQPDKVVTQLNEVTLAVKYLIEWTITNPENTQDRFAGSIYLYQLKQDLSTNSKNLNVGSYVDENLKRLVASDSFTSLSKADTINFINNYIKTCNDSNITKLGIQLFSSDEKFPIFYRPNTLTYSVISSSSDLSNIDSKNIYDIFSQIKLNPSLLEGGFGLIYRKNTVGTPVDISQIKVPQVLNVNSPTTYGAIGSDKFFLLSYGAGIPGKGSINFNDTLYGISLDTFVEEVIPKTSSMVRGEELLELINLIVRFMVTHTHAYPGLPPVPITQDGTSVSQILTELQNAVNKILNENIRLN